MVKPLKSKLNILQRRQQERTSMITHGKARVLPQDKGAYLGSCNRSACLKPGANFYNWSTQKYYCEECAHWLNCDEFNARDAKRMYGHQLCTQGKPAAYLEATVDDIMPIFERLAQSSKECANPIHQKGDKPKSLDGWVREVTRWTVIDVENPFPGNNPTSPYIYYYDEVLAKHPRVNEMYASYLQDYEQNTTASSTVD